MKDMKKCLELKKNTSEVYYKAKLDFNIMYSEFWLNTNWKEVLDNKKPTIKDKESWIKLQPTYQKSYNSMKQAQIDRDYVHEKYELMKIQKEMI